MHLYTRAEHAYAVHGFSQLSKFYNTRPLTCPYHLTLYPLKALVLDLVCKQCLIFPLLSFAIPSHPGSSIVEK
jgi:hypothetical protein